MAKQKSILEKFSEAVKDLADSASKALKAEEPPRLDRTSAVFMSPSAEGPASDPLLAPQIATQPAQRKRRLAKSSAAWRRARTARKSAPKKSAQKSTNKSAPGRSGKTAAKSANANSRPVVKTTKRMGTSAGKGGRQQ